MAVDWPYGILNLLKIYLKKLEKGIDSIIKVINYVNLNINDSILFPLCLYYTPNEIAFSCILLAKEENKFDFINITDLIKLNNNEVENEQIKECSLHLSKIIKCNLASDEDFFTEYNDYIIAVKIVENIKFYF